MISPGKENPLGNQDNDLVDVLNSQRVSILLGHGWLAPTGVLLDQWPERLQSYAGWKPWDGDSDLLAYVQAQNLDEKDKVAGLYNVSKSIEQDGWPRLLIDAPWRCIISSSPDEVLLRLALDYPQEPTIISSPQKTVDSLHNRSNLPMVYLFGSVTKGDAADYPPLSPIHLRRRRAQALNMLDILQSLIVPDGHLIIEGLTEQDWLPLNNLVDKLFDLDLPPGRIHLFGKQSESVLREMEALHELGCVIYHQNSLQDLLQYLIDDGRLNLRHQLIPTDPQRTVTIINRFKGERDEMEEKRIPIQFREDEWFRLNTRFRILADEDVVQKTLSSSLEEIWKQFLAAPTIGGIVQGLAFARPSYRKLRNHVEKLSKRKPRNRSVLLLTSGHAGSGVTIGLQWLAVSLRRSGRFVIYASPTDRRPDVDQIQYIARRCSSAGSDTHPIVIWDGSRRPSDYARLAREIGKDGTSVIVVGSCFPTDFQSDLEVIDENGEDTVSERDAFRTHEIPTSVDDEYEKLKEYLVTYIGGERAQNVIASAQAQGGAISDFFACLYHFGVETHGELFNALSEEHARVEEWLRQRTEKVGAKPDTLLELIRIVVVAGRYGHTIPVELALRTCGPQGFSHYVQYGDFLAKSGVIVEYPLDSENVRSYSFERFFGTRLQLIANKLCENLGMSANDRVNLVFKILRSVKTHGWIQERTEWEWAYKFLYDLVGEQGRYRKREDFINRWREFADLCEELFEQRADHRFALIASTLLKDEVQHSKPPEEEANHLLNKAFAIIRRAEEELDSGHNKASATKIKQLLFTQMASIKAHQAGQILRQNQTPSPSDLRRLDELQQDIDHYARNGESGAFASYYGRIIRIYSRVERLKLYGNAMSDDERLTLISQVQGLIDTTEEDLCDEGTLSRLHIWMYKFDTYCGRSNLEESLDHMFASSSVNPDTIYQMARINAFGDTCHNDLPLRTLSDESRAREAWAILERFKESQRDHAPSQILRLRLWWLRHTGKKLLPGERGMTRTSRDSSGIGSEADDLRELQVRVKLSHEEWNDLINLCQAVLDTDPTQHYHRFRFLRAWGAMQIKKYSLAQRYFQELEGLTREIPRRFDRLGYLCDTGGNKMTFRVEVIDPTSRMRWRVFSPDLQWNLPLNIKESPDVQLKLKKGIYLDVAIGLNYFGPFALPVENGETQE